MIETLPSRDRDPSFDNTITFKQESAAESSSAMQSSCFDIDQYINLDQAVLSSPSISPAASQPQSIPTTTSSTSSSRSSLPPASSLSSDNFISLQPPPPQTFSGPSHQYEQYKQQTGLPVGALANTFAINQPAQFSYGQSQYGMGNPNDGYFGMNTVEDVFDFGTAPDQTPSADMDLDFGNSPDTVIENTDPTFVDPAAIGGQVDTPRPYPTQIRRVWPGMHQQQAALAKAEAQAQQQRRQQALEQERQAAAAASSRRPSQSHKTSSARPSDDVVEESISRLLKTMRNNSVDSTNDDEASTPTAGGSHSSRTKKDEEDMDDDERLLASEEGKKLSSKERRQLRNKVSARAFRSRRKEYIGQLEGELAAKSNEADDLRAKNEDLMAENTRLTDLTRMLLSSPSFSTFLNDISGNGSLPSIPEHSQIQVPQQQQQPQAAPRKDVNPHQVTARHQGHQQNNVQIGMAMIPESASEYSVMDSTNNSWAENSTNMDFGHYDAQVFAVTSVPEGPAIDSFDFTMLHGKSTDMASSYPFDDVKDMAPSVEYIPSASTDSPVPIDADGDLEIDEPDPACALFQVHPPATPRQCTVEPEHRNLDEIDPGKALERLDLVVSEDAIAAGQVSISTLERFERLCSRIEAPMARVAAVTSHL